MSHLGCSLAFLHVGTLKRQSATTGSADPAPLDPLAGTSYRADRVLGKGSMGTVYLATHVALGSRSVLKVLHPHHATAPELVERMRIEAQTLAHLKSPHILSCTDFGTTADGATYFVTEFLGGRTLQEELAERGHLPIFEALELIRQVLSGLGVAHRAGIVHRDIKPANLFLADEPQRRTVKILDFGVAKILASREASAPAPSAFPTADGTMVGTARYCSPEQVLTKPIDHRADLYSVGLVLYRMVAGRGPFDDARSMSDLLLAQALQPPPPPSQVASVPAELDAIVLRALEKDPSARYASTEAFIAAIDDLERELRLVSQPAALATALEPSTAPLAAAEDASSGDDDLETWIREPDTNPLTLGIASVPAAAVRIRGMTPWQPSVGASSGTQRRAPVARTALAVSQRDPDASATLVLAPPPRASSWAPSPAPTPGGLPSFGARGATGVRGVHLLAMSLSFLVVVLLGLLFLGVPW